MSNQRDPFSDRDLEALLGLLREVDSLDSPLHHAAANRTHAAPPASTRRTFSAASADDASSTRFSRGRLFGSRWAAAAIGAAACGVFWIFQPAVQPTNSRVAQAGMATSPRVSYAHEFSRGGASQRHCLSATWAEPLSILAVIRTWSSDCQCLVWDLYEFDGESPVTRTRMNESLQVTATIEASEPPPVDQVLLFAVARDRRDLPQSSDESANFLECLLEGSPSSDTAAKLDQYKRVVSACLPDSVDVLPHLLARP